MVKSFILKSPQFAAGSAAMLLSLAYLAKGCDDIPVFLASLFLFVICATDTLFSKIFNHSILLFASAALIYHFQRGGAFGISESLLGLLCGLSLFLIPYLLGGMGAGDVKALAALGALLGATTIFHVFLYTALIGGFIAAINSLCEGHPLQTLRSAFIKICSFCISGDISSATENPACQALRFPYAPAISFGFFSYLHWGKLI